MYTRSFKVPWGDWIDVYSHIMPQDDVALSQPCDRKKTEDDMIWNFKSNGSREHLIMLVSQPQTPSSTNFKEAEGWQKVSAFFIRTSILISSGSRWVESPASPGGSWGFPRPDGICNPSGVSWIGSEGTLLLGESSKNTTRERAVWDKS